MPKICRNEKKVVPLQPHLTKPPSVMKTERTFEGCLVLTNLTHQTMYLDKEKKVEIFSQYGKSATDTGSAEAQIALFTYRIKHLTEHLKKNHKDHNTARSLTMMVGRRRKLLKYLYVNDINRYRAIVKALGLRK